jgi:proline iminopeptidase
MSRPRQLKIRDASLFVQVVGQGYPLVLMHGGPGLDHWSLMSFRRCADQFTLVFYDHRCNGRSEGAPLASMTWENLTADADALRQQLGFEKWAVLGHSFGGNVALEYALRYPNSLSHLVLLDTAGESRWPRENASKLLLARGWSARRAELARRWFCGEFEPREFLSIAIQIIDMYPYDPSLWKLTRDAIQGEWHTKARSKALIFGGRHLLKGWSVMNRLGEIKVPTLVMAGRADVVFPPEHQHQLAAGIPNARLKLIDHAGHNPQTEQPKEVMAALREFIAAKVYAA